MADQKKRKYQKYKRKKNSVNVTIYDPHGETIPVEARQDIEVALSSLALKYKLLTAVIVE